MSLLFAANAILSVVFFRRKKYFATFVISATVLFVMFCNCAVTTSNRYAKIDYGQTHRVTGKVYASSFAGGECGVTLEELEIDGVPCGGKLSIKADKSDVFSFISRGYRVALDCKLAVVDISGGNGYALDKDVRYRTYSTAEAINVEVSEIGLIDRLHGSLYTLLTGRMGDKLGAVAYGMLTGERDAMDESAVTYYGISGLGHILAVSGLHVGFIVAALLWLLRKVSVKIRAVISIIVVLGYAAFTGFSPSVVRASVMSVVSLSVMPYGKRADILNSLSFALTVILALSPFALFGAGLVMSFSAVFGIACFGRMIERLLKKIKTPSAIAATIGVSASAQIGITPSVLYFFHGIMPYSVIVNLIVLPLVSVAFVLLFVIALLSVVPPLSVLLFLPHILLAVIDGIAEFSATLPFARITVYTSAAVFFVLPIYFVISGYFMLTKFKRTTAAVSALLAVVVCALSVQTFGFDRAVVAVGAGGVTSVVAVDGKYYVVGDCRNGGAIERAVTDCRIPKIDGVFLTSLDVKTAESLTYLYDKKLIDTVYFPLSEDAEGVTVFTENDRAITLFSTGEAIGGIKPEYAGEKFIGYSMPVTANKKILFLGSAAKSSYLSGEIMRNVAAVRSKAFFSAYSDRIFLIDITPLEGNEYCFAVGTFGRYIFDLATGILYAV